MYLVVVVSLYYLCSNFYPLCNNFGVVVLHDAEDS